MSAGLGGGAGGDKGCTAYVVTLSSGGADVAGELAWAAKAVAVAAADGAPAHAFVLTSEAPALAEVEVQPHGAGAAGGRRLASSATPLVYTAAGPITMTPGILTGLLLAVFLIFFTCIGVSCVASVRTPDVLHSTPLMAGKEY